MSRHCPGRGQHELCLARIARLAILGLVLAMGLRAMGIADDIVNLAFALVLGALAVAFAVAFGLGGREAAGELAKQWLADYRNNKYITGAQRPLWLLLKRALLRCGSTLWAHQLAP